tara:strand:- start:91 stop:306 length:216 start_codon:yes stop_codon:yes gene_type:complete
MARTKVAVSLKYGTRVVLPFTAADEVQRLKDEVTAKIQADMETQKLTDRLSGKQKLLDLGLTQAEVDAVTG